MKQNNIYDQDWINTNGNWVHATAIVYWDWVSIGTGNVIGAFCVIGGNGEMRNVDQSEFKGKVIIGNNNVISEMVTIQRPFDESATKIGDNNIIMAHSHLGHNVEIQNGCEICTGSIIGGYCVVEDGAKIKLGVTIRNRKRIGKGSLIGLGSAVVKDVEANTVVVGNPAKELKMKL